jgi:cytochrome c-type biogenesis protein CcmF
VEALGKEYSSQKSILLTQGDTLPMGPYYVAYKGKKREGIKILYNVEYFTKSSNGKLIKSFDLFPRITLNDRGNAAEPDTKHYLKQDIYTHVTYANLNLSSETESKNGYDEPVNNIIHIGDTLQATNAIVILDSLKTNVTQDEYEKNDSSIMVTAVIKAFDMNKRVYKTYPKYLLKRDRIEPIQDSIAALGLKFIFWKINPDEGSVEISVAEKQQNKKDYIVMEAYMFPFINILWVGCLVMIVGTVIAIVSRIRSIKIKSSARD